MKFWIFLTFLNFISFTTEAKSVDLFYTPTIKVTPIKSRVPILTAWIGNESSNLPTRVLAKKQHLARLGFFVLLVFCFAYLHRKEKRLMTLKENHPLFFTPKNR